MRKECVNLKRIIAVHSGAEGYFIGAEGDRFFVQWDVLRDISEYPIELLNGDLFKFK
jgi:hypothetical protein